MKKIFKSLVALLCCGAVFASCQKDAAPEVNMEVDVTSIEAEAQNPEEAAVTLTTNVSWILTCPDWVTPSATYGNGDAILTFSIASNYKDETTTTRARSGEIKISGGGTLTGKGAVVTIPVNQQGYTYVDPNPSLGGITDAEEFAKFIVAANTGGSLKRWTSDANEVLLLTDIDLSGVDIKWQELADATKTSNANNACSIVENTTPFEGVFNGDNHKITGFNPVVVLEANQTFGLFQVAHNATIKNLELSGTFNVTATDQADAGMLVGTAIHSTISNVKIGGKVVSAGTTASKRFSIGGVCGYAYAGLVGETEYGKTLFEGCVVNAEVEFDGGTNQANGATAAMYGGICGFATTPNADAAHKVTIKNCVNNGNMNVKIGRCSGILATANTGVILQDVTNNGDQVNNVANGRLGNIVCNISYYCTLKNCINNGDLTAVADGYKGTAGGIFALAGAANITGMEGLENYGTIKTLNTAGKYVGLLWANHNNTIPTTNCVASGRIFIDGAEVEISEANYMEKVGYMKDPSCVTNVRWVAPK